jgi:hypothetical protein
MDKFVVANRLTCASCSQDVLPVPRALVLKAEVGSGFIISQSLIIVTQDFTWSPREYGEVFYCTRKEVICELFGVSSQDHNRQDALICTVLRRFNNRLQC